MAPKDIHSYVEGIVGPHLHAKQVQSLANGVVGTIHSVSLAIAAIGTGLAMAEGLLPKHAIKQVDRLLSLWRRRQRDPPIGGEVIQSLHGSGGDRWRWG